MTVVTVAILFTLTSCKVTTVPVTIMVPGKLNLQGISKIGLIDFNSLPNDSFIETYCADKETIALVQQMVAGAFFKNKFYQVTDLDIENFIKDKYPNSKLHQRFDALIYGRLWWQIAPEISGVYPKVFNLSRWSNVKYKSGTNPLTNEPIYSTVRVINSTNEKIAMIPYRAWGANLMLSLTIYKLGNNGQIEKLTETFSVAEHEFILENGEFREQYTSLIKKKHDQISKMQALEEKESFFSSSDEKKDTKGEYKVIRKCSTIPTPLQGQMALASVLSSDLICKISPSQQSFNIICDFDDKKLYELLKNGAYYGARRYIINKVLADENDKAAKLFGDLDFDQACTVMVKRDDPDIDAEDIADANSNFIEDKISYIYALGICDEATGEYKKALETYRYAFKSMPDKRIAMGISRCLLALGMRDRMNEQENEKRKASRKTKLN